MNDNLDTRCPSCGKWLAGHSPGAYETCMGGPPASLAPSLRPETSKDAGTMKVGEDEPRCEVCGSIGVVMFSCAHSHIGADAAPSLRQRPETPIGWPKCPGCGNKLHPVTNDSEWLNSEQFDSVKAGDFYCSTCKDATTRSGFRYFWESDFEADAAPARCNCDPVTEHCAACFVAPARDPRETPMAALVCTLCGLLGDYDQMVPHGAEEGPTHPPCIELAKLRAGTMGDGEDAARLGELLTEVAISGVEFEDERVGYVLVQIDRATWNAVRKASDARLPARDDVRGILRQSSPSQPEKP